jgi:hypothetical protein
VVIRSAHYGRRHHGILGFDIGEGEMQGLGRGRAILCFVL